MRQMWRTYSYTDGFGEVDTEEDEDDEDWADEDWGDDDWDDDDPID